MKHEIIILTGFGMKGTKYGVSSDDNEIYVEHNYQNKQVKVYFKYSGERDMFYGKSRRVFILDRIEKDG